MQIDFEIGEKVWVKGIAGCRQEVIAQISIDKTGSVYQMESGDSWRVVGKSQKEVLIKTWRDDIESHKRFIEYAEHKIAELERG